MPLTLLLRQVVRAATLSSPELGTTSLLLHPASLPRVECAGSAWRRLRGPVIEIPFFLAARRLLEQGRRSGLASHPPLPLATTTTNLSLGNTLLHPNTHTHTQLHAPTLQPIDSTSYAVIDDGLPSSLVRRPSPSSWLLIRAYPADRPTSRLSRGIENSVPEDGNANELHKVAADIAAGKRKDLADPGLYEALMGKPDATLMREAVEAALDESKTEDDRV
jgi:hypothetical protein